MLFLSLVSAEYIKMLNSDMYLGVDKNDGLVPVEREGATKFSRESVNDKQKSPLTRIKDPQERSVLVDSNENIKLSSKEMTSFRIVMSSRGGFFISTGDRCLGHGSQEKMEIGSCSDINFKSLFLFENNKDGTRADVRMKSKNRVLDSKPVISLGRCFFWDDIKNTNINSLLSPFSDKPDKKKVKSDIREFVKFNEF